MKRWLACAFVVCAACSKRRAPAPARSDPAAPSSSARPVAEPFVATIAGTKHALSFGTADVVFEHRALRISLTSAATACRVDGVAPDPATPSPDYTVWIDVPADGEGLYVGRPISQVVLWRERLDHPARITRDRVILRIDEVSASRVRGHLTLRKDPSDAIEGDGDFDLALCDGDDARALVDVKPRPIDAPVHGTIAGRPFTLARAFVSPQGAMTITDDADTTCDALETSTLPASVPPPRIGSMIALTDYDAHARSSLQPAIGVYLFAKSAAGRLESEHYDVPFGFAISFDRFDVVPGGHAAGTLRGWSTEAKLPVDVAGTFDATVCPKR